MDAQRIYANLPFSWQDRSPQTVKNDCRWLESIVRNAAPFSDWWTKARIVQLAYPKPPRARSEAASVLPTYAGLDSEAAIVSALRSLCNLAQYPGFRQAASEDFVIQTLNAWKSQQFAQYSHCSYEIYEDRNAPNIFLIASTAKTVPGADRTLPPVQRFRALFNVEELAWLLCQRQMAGLTLRTHGYATPETTFYRRFQAEVLALTQKDLFTQGPTLDPKQAYIGYHWPSEKPLFSSGLWKDGLKNWGILARLLLPMGLLSGICGALLFVFLQFFGVPLLSFLGEIPGIAWLWQWLQFERTARLAAQWYWITPTLLMSWLMFFQLLRGFAYQRDRSRASSYGAPDLAEFFAQLGHALSTPQNWPQPAATPSTNPQFSLILNAIGHGLGAKVLVDAIHRLSGQGGNLDAAASIRLSIGQHLQLNHLTLVAPDIAIDRLCEGHNNAVRSAFQCVPQIYLLSSDRDLVLRYGVLLSSWLNQPSLTTAGFRWGNVYLKRSQHKDQQSQDQKSQDQQARYLPAIRDLLRSQPLARAMGAYDAIDRTNYLDCSDLAVLSAVRWRVHPLLAIAIDGINSCFCLLGRLAVHQGYFESNAPSFEILKFLIAARDRSETEVQQHLSELVKNTPIRFLPSRSGATPLSKPDSPEDEKSLEAIESAEDIESQSFLP